jgi:hypothetical protein
VARISSGETFLKEEVYMNPNITTTWLSTDAGLPAAAVGGAGLGAPMIVIVLAVALAVGLCLIVRESWQDETGPRRRLGNRRRGKHPLRRRANGRARREGGRWLQPASATGETRSAS